MVMDCADGLGSPEEAKEEDSNDVEQNHEDKDQEDRDWDRDWDRDRDQEERPDGLDSPVEHIPNGVAVQDQDPDIQLINRVQDD